LLKEKKFLSEEKKIRCRGKLTQDAIESNVMRHNESCDKDMLSIDSKIFKLLDIEKREIEMIYRDIRELNVYDYGCVNSFEQIFG
jgi:hypothetical protein